MNQGQITDQDCVRMRKVSTADVMQLIAVEFLGFTAVDVKNIRSDSSSSEDFNREIIRLWANKPSGDNQKQVLHSK